MIALTTLQYISVRTPHGEAAVLTVLCTLLSEPGRRMDPPLPAIFFERTFPTLPQTRSVTRVFRKSRGTTPVEDTEENNDLVKIVSLLFLGGAAMASTATKSHPKPSHVCPPWVVIPPWSVFPVYPRANRKGLVRPCSPEAPRCGG